MTAVPSVPVPDLDTIRQRADKATKGPWAVRCFDEGIGLSVVSTSTSRVVADLDFEDTAKPHEENAEFIAHARTDVPALIAALVAVEAERDTLAASEDEGLIGECGACGRTTAVRGDPIEDDTLGEPMDLVCRPCVERRGRGTSLDAAVDALLAERRRIVKTVTKVEAALRALGAPVSPPRRWTRRERPGAPSVEVLRLMREHAGRVMGAAEVWPLLSAKGWTPQARDPRNLVAVTLLYLYKRGDLARAGRGAYVWKATADD